MGLSKALKSQANTIIKLRKLPTLPTTEDLHYLLATAIQQKKPAELPFKNPYNNISFKVRVVPATRQHGPRWTFERVEAGGEIFLWMRESTEIIMVQGKIKIEANYTGIGQQSAHDGVEEVLLPEEDGGKGQAGSTYLLIEDSSAGDYLDEAVAPPEHENLETWEQTEGSDPSAESLCEPEPEPTSDIEEGRQATLNTSASVQSEEYHPGNAWMRSSPAAGPVGLPPPIEIAPDIVSSYMTALSNPATGLLRRSAFEFFLLRDAKYALKNGGELSLVVFDLVDPDTQKPVKISNDAAAMLSQTLSQLCGVLEPFTQLKSGEFAILLSGRGSKAAIDFTEKLLIRLPEESTDLSVLADLKALAAGVATIPETCRDPGTLVAAAIKAKNLARQSHRGFMLFPIF